LTPIQPTTIKFTSPFAAATQHELNVATSPFAATTVTEMVTDYGLGNDMHDNNSDTESMFFDNDNESVSDNDSNNKQDNADNDDNTNTDDDDNIDTNSLCDKFENLILHHPIDKEMVIDVADIDDIKEVLEDKDKEEKITKKNFFLEIDNESVKLVSYPQLKETIENHLCCKLCASERRIGYLNMKQETFKLATVLTLTCKYGHTVDIVLERIDKTKRHSSDNFKINFYFILAMQLLGKGLRTMCTFLGLLGIRTSEGDYKVWKKIQEKIGESEQRVAKQCCAENLRKEVEATIASGILPLSDGRVPIACSGDTGWQGNGSRMTYNSQSGQTTLCRGRTKKVVAYKCFSKLCRTCQDHSSKHPGTEEPPPQHRCPKNWSEASKSMEPHSILACAISVWESCIAWLDIFISNKLH